MPNYIILYTSWMNYNLFVERQRQLLSNVSGMMIVKILKELDVHSWIDIFCLLFFFFALWESSCTHAWALEKMHFHFHSFVDWNKNLLQMNFRFEVVTTAHKAEWVLFQTVILLDYDEE